MLVQTVIITFCRFRYILLLILFQTDAKLMFAKIIHSCFVKNIFTVIIKFD